MATIKEQLEKDGPIKRATVIVAAWCRYLELAGTPGHNWEIQDKMGVVLQDNAIASASSDPLAFLKIKTIFNDLVFSKRFVDTYLPIIDNIRKYGVEKTRETIEDIHRYAKCLMLFKMDTKEFETPGTLAPLFE